MFIINRGLFVLKRRLLVTNKRLFALNRRFIAINKELFALNRRLLITNKELFALNRRLFAANKRFATLNRCLLEEDKGLLMRRRKALPADNGGYQRAGNIFSVARMPLWIIFFVAEAKNEILPCLSRTNAILYFLTSSGKQFMQMYCFPQLPFLSGKISFQRRKYHGLSTQIIQSPCRGTGTCQ